MRVLLVEDDELLGDGVSVGLQQAGYKVDWMRDGEQALRALEGDGFDLMVLDLGLPGIDGLEVLQQLRGQGNDLPVLVLTARDTVDDRINGLDSGADDYLVKPFDLNELAARLRAIQRRRDGRGAPQLRCGQVLMDQAARRVYLDGAVVPCTGREYAVLEALLSPCGRVLTRQRLEQLLYGWDDGVESNAIEVYIHHLRKKLGKELIRTVRGVGYMIPNSAQQDE